MITALLSLAGKGTDRGHIRFLGGRQAAARRSRLWAAVVGQVVGRPLLLGGLATVTLVALAAPVLSLHLEDAGIHGLPANVPVVRSLLDIQRASTAGPGGGPGGGAAESGAAESGGRIWRPFGIKGNGGGAVLLLPRRPAENRTPKAEHR